MIRRRRRLLVGGGASGLVRPGALTGRVTYTRTGLATGIAPSGSIYEVAANVPRFNAAGEAFWEGQRSNVFPNPRAEGSTTGVVGSGGAPPTSWQSLAGPTGPSRAYTAAVSWQGMSVPGLRIFGTATAGAWLFGFQTRASAGAAAASQTWTATVPIRLVSGSIGDISSLVIRGLGLDAAGNVVGVNTYTSAELASSLTSDWYNAVHTFTFDASGTIARVAVEVNWTPVTGVASDTTLAFGWHNVELASFGSTHILPAAGVPAASTRGADTGVATLLAGTGAGSLVFAMRPRQAAGATAQVYLSVSAGADADRIEIVNLASGNDMRMTRVVTSVGTSTTTLGNQVPGSMTVGVVSWDGSGNAAAKIRGGTYRSIGSITTGMTQARIGNRVSGAAALFGAVGWLDELPGRYLTEAQMDVEIAKLARFT